METKEIIKRECNSDNIVIAETAKKANLFDKQKTVIAAILLFTMLISIFVAPFIVDKMHIIEGAKETLDSKKDTVVALTATTAAISVGISLILCKLQNDNII